MVTRKLEKVEVLVDLIEGIWRVDTKEVKVCVFRLSGGRSPCFASAISDRAITREN
jgi:hypothetical protein